MTAENKHQIISSITVPEIKSCIARLLDTMDSVEDSRSHRLTILALVSFYRLNLNNPMSIDTDNNQLKAKLINSGVLYFGSMWSPVQVEVPRAKRLNTLEELGFCTEHLAFLNPTQVVLFTAYVAELGLVRTAA